MARIGATPLHLARRLRIGADAGDFAGIDNRAAALPFADMGVEFQRRRNVIQIGAP
jgi:hypothetical protein